MTWKLSSPCRVSSMVIESTRNGMSSVTMSTAPRDSSSAEHMPPALTCTRARPCGRLAASRACSVATPAIRLGPAANSSSTGMCR
jgi:hypothetical protein